MKGDDMERNDATYWERKIRFFLHDPFDKVLKIPGHEKRAQQIAEAVGELSLDKRESGLADIMASGLDRANLPGYSPDTSQNGAIDFFKEPCLTHPISGGPALNFTASIDSAEVVTSQIVRLIKDDTDRLDCIWTKQAYFNYLFFVLRRRLVEANCGQLGYLWHRLPADSRIPDHSIWNHAGMVSALGSAVEDSPYRNASMVVFSITPVQSFIAKTRKLRDHWAASVILSWLCFEGIVTVIECLGPDHVIYPSLQDQPLVDDYLSTLFPDLLPKADHREDLYKDYSVASLPNKFVFIAPSGFEVNITEAIEIRISQKWKNLAGIVLEYVSHRGGHVEKIFTRQTHSFWRFGWSAAKLIELEHQPEIEQLFGKEKFKQLFETIRKFSESYPAANILYSATHTLAQSALAASKTRPLNVRAPEPGIKCPVCGEFEVLHEFNGPDSPSRGAYKAAADGFWQKLLDRFGATNTLKENEKLCAICTIKRFAPIAIKTTKLDHPLKINFRDDHKFPSTTEMATCEYRRQLRELGLLTDTDIERKIIDELHETPDKRSIEVTKLLSHASKKGLTLDDEDNYYSILMMDGDKMGELVNGTRIPAKWKEVLHPQLASRYASGTLVAKQALWQVYMKKQRILSPGLHAALSESLGAFSLYAVPQIIRECQGKLIYAGGDDVAAVLPLSSAILAAMRIRKAYNTRFVTFSSGALEEAGPAITESMPLLLFPGNGKGISISGALLICHHKQPLRGALEETKRLLTEVAKYQTGRNAFAIRLKKRSGQTRDFAAQWDDHNPFCTGSACTVLESFQKVQKAYNRPRVKGVYTDGELSSSLLYRLPALEVMMHAILPADSNLISDIKSKIMRVLAYEIGRTGTLQKKFPGEHNKTKRHAVALDLSTHIAGISIRWNKDAGKKGAWEFNGEVAVIARYLSRGGDQQ